MYRLLRDISKKFEPVVEIKNDVEVVVDVEESKTDKYVYHENVYYDSDESREEEGVDNDKDLEEDSLEKKIAQIKGEEVIACAAVKVEDDELLAEPTKSQESSVSFFSRTKDCLFGCGTSVEVAEPK
jgi:hypothetical protein